MADPRVADVTAAIDLLTADTQTKPSGSSASGAAVAQTNDQPKEVEARTSRGGTSMHVPESVPVPEGATAAHLPSLCREYLISLIRGLAAAKGFEPAQDMEVTSALASDLTVMNFIHPVARPGSVFDFKVVHMDRFAVICASFAGSSDGLIPSVVCSLTLDCQQYVSGDAGEGGVAMLSAKHYRDLSTTVDAKVLQPLLGELSYLPSMLMDMKREVMAYLPAQALINLGCTSSSFRVIAQDDDLWLPLCRDDFQLTAARGCKEVYRGAVVAANERDASQEARRRAMERDARLSAIRDPYAPFGHAGGPELPYPDPDFPSMPGMVGGDYDLHPGIDPLGNNPLFRGRPGRGPGRPGMPPDMFPGMQGDPRRRPGGGGEISLRHPARS